MNAKSLLRLPFLGASLALIAAIAITGLLASRDSAAQATFSPSSTYGVSDSSPGANADIISTFTLPSGDLQFGGTINFTPPDWTVARDEDIPDGAIVAELASTATLGLIGDGCDNSLGVPFTLLDGTTDPANGTVPLNDPEVDLDPPDTNDSQGSEPDDEFDIGPDGELALGVTRYPDYLTRIFRDAQGNTVLPISRLIGHTEPVGTGVDVSLNFLLFEPGVSFVLPNGTEVITDPRLGYPSVTVLQAGGDPQTEANTGDTNTISDFCSPLNVNTTTFGLSQDNPNTAADESGVVFRTNPGDGTHNFVIYAISAIDTDGDGIENGLDPCPLNPNPNWDPRKKISNPAYSGDEDKDSLPTECDPDDTDPGFNNGGVWDHDNDLYGNRADNCPLVANSAGQPGGSGPDNQIDSDSDGLGDACDDNPTDPDGERIELCIVTPLTIGAGGPDPSPASNTLQPCGNEPLPVEGQDTTPTPGATPTPTSTGNGTTTGDGSGGPATGIGSLAPAASSIPAWATILSGLGGAGLLGSLGALAARFFGIRLPGRRE